jgi:hypothetical protein
MAQTRRNRIAPVTALLLLVAMGLFGAARQACS